MILLLIPGSRISPGAFWPWAKSPGTADGRTPCGEFKAPEDLKGFL